MTNCVVLQPVLIGLVKIIIAPAVAWIVAGILMDMIYAIEY